MIGSIYFEGRPKTVVLFPESDSDSALPLTTTMKKTDEEDDTSSTVLGVLDDASASTTSNLAGGYGKDEEVSVVVLVGTSRMGDCILIHVLGRTPQIIPNGCRRRTRSWPSTTSRVTIRFFEW